MTSEHGATLFLNEVGKLRPEHQERLLKALTERAVVSWPKPMVPRAIACTSEPLFDRVHAGTFDAELFYRLNLIHIDLRQQPAKASPLEVQCAAQTQRPRGVNRAALDSA